MKTVDGTSWIFDPVAELTTKDEYGNTVVEEKRNPFPLTGRVETYAKINGVNKEPMLIAGKSYGPELYTKKQVESIAVYRIGEYEDPNFDYDFDNYAYIAWNIRVTAEGNQAYELYLRDIMNVRGAEVVGFRQPYQVASDPLHPGMLSYIMHTETEKRNYNDVFTVVTRCPKNRIKNSDGSYKEIYNDAFVTLLPADHLDEPMMAQDREPIVYKDFHWVNHAGNDWVRKSDAGDFYSWLDVYNYARTKGKDKGDFKFEITSDSNGYSITHVASGDGTIGERKEGCYYEVAAADDLLWAYCNDEENRKIQLTGADYYFSSVSAEINDTDYDPYEDEKIYYGDGAELPKLEMYAIFADNKPENELDSVQWELVSSDSRKFSFNGRGRWSFSFNAEELARKPYRVKVVDRSSGYSVSSKLSVTVRIRYDSPVFADFMRRGIKSLGRDGEVSKITVINEAAFIRKNITPQGTTAVVNVTDEKTKELYPNGDANTAGAALRVQGKAVLHPVTVHANSFKQGTAENDPIKGRIKIRYDLTEYDGYLIFDENSSAELEEAGLCVPGRRKVVFADLLPEGIRYDASEKVYAGRLMSMEDLDKSYNIWNASQVKNPVISAKTDIIENYNNTGRTLVRIHLELDENADPSLIMDGSNGKKLWGEGWGVSFGAYYYWRDERQAGSSYNHAAFLPDDVQSNPSMSDVPLFGEDDIVFPDDGNPCDGKEECYNSFLGDINGDGIENVKSVIYMKGRVTDSVAQSFQSIIEKLVRDDDEGKLGAFTKSATVLPGHTYTYEINIQTAQQPLQDIVIYDYFESAAERDSYIEDDVYDDHEKEFPDIPSEQLDSSAPSFKKKEQNYWKGEFNKIEKEGINSAVKSFNENLRFQDLIREKGEAVPEYYYYYSDDKFENRKDVLIQPDEGVSVSLETPETFLTHGSTPENRKGWYTEQEWRDTFHNEPTGLNKCRGIAIDLKHYVLDSFSSIRFRLNMTSPQNDLSIAGRPAEYYADAKHSHNSNEAVRTKTATYAFNDVKYLGKEFNNNETKVITSNSVKVNQLSEKVIEVEKKFDDIHDIPAGMENISFDFRQHRTIAKQHEK